jgi:hypothetical protein
MARFKLHNVNHIFKYNNNSITYYFKIKNYLYYNVCKVKRKKEEKSLTYSLKNVVPASARTFVY